MSDNRELSIKYHGRWTLTETVLESGEVYAFVCHDGNDVFDFHEDADPGWISAMFDRPHIFFEMVRLYSMGRSEGHRQGRREGREALQFELRRLLNASMAEPKKFDGSLPMAGTVYDQFIKND